MKILRNTLWASVGLFGLAALLAMPAAADQVILDDLIVDGSACIGFDCVNGESFGFDTIRIKENNLRIKAQDTSSTASFPTQDWQLTFNDSTNGGQNKFSVDAISPSSSTPFTIEAGAPSHSLYVDDGGRLGFGTSTPVADLHVKTGNTPTLRLEQDGSSGFTAQTWDVAGNEANFFIRDATNGSTLPIRLRPGAPTSAFDIAASGDVGFGTSSPQEALHIVRSSGNTRLEVESTAGTPAQAGFILTNSLGTWNTLNLGGAGASAGSYIINQTDDGTFEAQLDDAGNLTLSGSINTSDCAPCVSDYVFEPDYQLMPLAELEEYVWREKHLPNVPSQRDVDRAGKLNMTQMQMRILEKVEEVVLYTIDQQKLIDSLQGQNSELRERLARLEAALAAGDG